MNTPHVEALRLILNARRLPARLNTQQTALLLGFQEHDIPILVRSKLLKPLGNPVPNAIKYFATCDLLLLMEDASWLNRATGIMSRHWSERNSRKTSVSVTAEVAA